MTDGKKDNTPLDPGSGGCGKTKEKGKELGSVQEPN